MNGLKEAIFGEVRKNKEELADISDSDLLKLLFHYADGMRLTYTGFIVLKNIFTVYSFELSENIRPKHRLAMSKFTYPYFFTKNRLILFSEMDATIITLSGGLDNFLEVHSK